MATSRLLLGNPSEDESPLYKSSTEAYQTDVAPKQSSAGFRSLGKISLDDLYSGGSPSVSTVTEQPRQAGATSLGKMSLDDLYGTPKKEQPKKVEPPKDDGDFLRGGGIALEQTPALLKGAVGLVGATGEKAFGRDGIFTALKNYGFEGFKQGMESTQAKAKDTDDVTKAWDQAKQGNLGALVDWAQYGLGYLGGNVIETALTAVAGGIIGGATAGPGGLVGGVAAGTVGKGGAKAFARNLIETAVEKEAARIAAKEGLEAGAETVVKQATKNVAKGIGSTGALLASGVTKGLGTVYGEGEQLAQEEGRELDAGDLARMWAAGTAAGLVEGAVDRLGVKAATGKINIPGGGRAGRVVVGGAAGGTLEGGTELIQSAIERYGAGKELTGEDAMNEYINSFALGALGGGTLGGLSGLRGKKADPDFKKRMLDQVETDLTSDDGRQELFDSMMQDERMARVLEANDIQSADDPRFQSVITKAVATQRLFDSIEIPTAEQRTETTKQRGEDVTAAFGDTASTGVGVGTGTGDPVIQRESVVANPETRTLDPVNGQAPVPVTLPDGAGARAGTQAMSGEDLTAAQQGFEVESAFNVGTGQIANRFRSQAQAETFLFGPVGQDGKRTGGYASSVPDLEFQIRRGQTSKDAGGNAFFFVESRPQVAAPAPAPASRAAPAPAPAVPTPAPVPAAGAPAPAAPTPAAPAPAAAAPAAPAQAPAAAPSAAPVNLASVAWDAFGGAKFDTVAPAVQQEWTEAVGEGYKPEVLANLYRNLSAPATTGAAPATTGAAPEVTPSATDAAPKQTIEQKLKAKQKAKKEAKAAAPAPATAAPTEATKPVEPKAPPAPAPAVTSAKKPTLRVTQYQDGSFGLDWLDRGGRPAVERTFKTEQEARDAAKQFGADEPVAPDVYVRPASAPAPKPAAEAPAPTPAAQKAIDAGRMRQAQNQWRQYAPEGVKFESLSEENKVRWRDAVESNTPNMELANELSGVKPAPTPAPTPSTPKQTVEQKVKAKQKAKKAASVEAATKKVPESEAIEIWDGNDPEDGSHIAWKDLPADVKSDWKAAVEDGYANTPEYDKLVERVRKNERAERANAKAAENQKKDDVVLRTDDGRARGMTVTAVRKVVDALRETWANPPSIIVVQNELALPQEISEFLESKDINNAKGLYWNGKVYILANHASGVSDVILTAAHEATGHFGLRQILGSSYTKLMNDIYKGNKSVREKADAMMAGEKLSLEHAVEEVLADMAEQNTRLALQGKPVPPETRNALQRIFAAIRQWLRSVGVSYVTDSDVRALVANARRYVVDGDVQAGSGDAALGAVLRGQAPTFYSGLDRAIRSPKVQNVMSADQWKNWLSGTGAKLGIKKEEVEWTGVAEFLQLKGKEKVTKDELLTLIDGNRLQLNDIILEGSGKYLTDDDLAELYAYQEGIGIEDAPVGWTRQDYLDALGMSSRDASGTRHSQERKGLVLPGGKKQFELILTEPSVRTRPYKESDVIHFGDISGGKTIGWIRGNLRKDAQGNDVLFLEEIQSQRGQDGREKGFGLGEDQVPPAPIVGDTKAWTALLLKRAIAYAQSKGIDRIAWTTGDEQVERYRLSKRFDKMSITKNEDGSFNVIGEQNDTKVVNKKGISEKELSGAVGKDLARMAASSEGDLVLTGREMDTGNDGLKSFYDERIGSVADKLLGTFGDGKTEVMEIDGLGKHQGFVIGTKLQQTVEQDGFPVFRRKDVESAYDDVPEDTKQLAIAKGTYVPPTIRERLEVYKQDLGKRLLQLFIDPYVRIKDISNELYMKNRLTRTVDGAIEGMLYFGEVFNDGGALNYKKDTKGLIEIMEPLGNETDRFLMWVAANRAGELKKQDRELFFKDDEIAKLKKLNVGQMKDGRQRVAVYADALRGLNSLNRSALNVALESGLIDEAGYKKFASDVWYVPFYRAMEDKDSDLSTLQTSTGSVNQYFSKVLKGSERPLNDLMQNTLMNWSHILSSSMKNQAARETLAAAQELGGMVTRLEKISDVMGRDKDGNVVPLKDTVKVMEKGKPVHYRIDDALLLQSVSAVSSIEKRGLVLRVGGAFTSLLTRGVALSPAYKTNMLIRDSIQSIGLTELSANPLKNAWEGIKDYKNERGEALVGGGVFTMGADFDANRGEATKRLVAKGVKSADILDTPEKLKDFAKSLWDKHNEIGDAFENANRLALYKQMRGKGASHLEATFAARDIQDYSLMGAWSGMRYIATLIPYLNSRVQGIYKIERDGITPTVKAFRGTANESQRKRAMKFGATTAAVTMAGLMLYLAYKDDEDFKDREDWDRDMFFWFKIPGTDKAIRIPKPFEMGAIATIAERVAEQIVDKDVEGKVFGQRMMSLLADTFAINPHFQIYRPLYDLSVNKDGLTDRPIETEAMQQLSPENRINPRTSGVAIGLSKLNSMIADGASAISLGAVDADKMQLSPIQYDYLLRGYLGWLGTAIQTTSYYAMAATREGEIPDLRTDDILFIGAYVRDMPSNQSKFVTNFYKSAQKAGTAAADYRNYLKLGEEEKAERFAEKNEELLASEPQYNSAKKQLTDINNQIKAVERDEEMTGAEKRAEMNRLYQERNSIAKEVELERIRSRREN